MSTVTTDESAFAQSFTSDWALLTRTPTYLLHCERWATTWPCLRQPAVWRLLMNDADAVDTQDGALMMAPFAALLTEIQSGDTMAARVLLRWMMPSVRALAFGVQRRRRCSYSDALTEVSGAMWMSIVTLTTSPRNIAASLHLRTVRTLHGRHAEEDSVSEICDSDLSNQIREDELTGGGLYELTSSHDPFSWSELTPTEAVVRTLTWGVSTGAITADEAVLLDRYMPPTGSAGRSLDHRTALASELGISSANLRQRASRAVRKLATAVQDAR